VQGPAPVAWSWEFGDRSNPSHWQPLSSAEQLADKYIVCLSPTLANYTNDAGLVIGEPGAGVSPPREEPRRPGYNPNRKESWSHHARAVARESVDRAAADGIPGWLSRGFTARFGLSPDDLVTTIRTTGLLHDLGKLQSSWQRWAQAWQASKEPHYQHTIALAHTDYDPDGPDDRVREKGFQPRRPPHAIASAYAAVTLLGGLLRVGDAHLECLASACLGAIASHHGAWLPDKPDLGVELLWPRWEQDVEDAGVADPGSQTMAELFAATDRRKEIAPLLEATTGADRLVQWWPLVAYLMRTLRLADQRATSEGTQGE